MYEFAGFRLDLRARRLLHGSQVIPITVKAFDTLAVLVEHAGAVVEKDELMRRVWPDAIVEEANLSQQIFLLRKILGEGPKDHRYVQTVPRRGYRFVAPVAAIEPAADIRAGHSPYATAGAAASATGQPLCLTLSLPGTAPLTLGASSPFALSPDGKTLAYAGRAQDGSCLYVRRLDFTSGERTHRWPNALPNGRDVLFTTARAGSASFDEAEICVASLESGERRTLVKHGSCAKYSPTGHLVYMRGSSMMAIGFDV